MRYYKYTAKTLAGEIKDGVSQAKSEHDVVVWLRENGLIPVDVKVYTPNKNGKRKWIKRHVKALELASFCWQLRTLLEGGIPITTSIDTIAEDNDNEYFKGVIIQIGEQIKRGETLHASIAKYPKVFNKLFYSLVMAGETGGSLTESLSRLAQYYEDRDKLIRKVRGATIYPALVVVFMILLVMFIMIFIMPRFTTLFKQIGGELPTMTKMLIGFYEFMKYNSVVIFLLIVVAIMGVYAYSRTKVGIAQFSRLSLRAPLLGNIKKFAFVVIYSRTLATLLGAGVSVLEALEILTTMSNNTVIKQALIRTREHLIEGSSISLSMAASGFFPNILVKMVQVGEESGSLPNVLNRTSEYYERKVDSTISTAMTVLEPLLIVGIGLVVLVVVLALYLPIFSLSDVKR